MSGSCADSDLSKKIGKMNPKRINSIKKPKKVGVVILL
jgi:hypothetical protein